VTMGPGPELPSNQPTFASTVTAVPPPPVSGGTLLALRDGNIAIAADPDRDAVYIVSTSSAELLHTVVLQPGDEPGRLVEDGAGLVHVALRSGALVTLDPTSGAIVTRRNVCPAPRGVAWDSSTNLVWVACATGELVALPSAGGPATKTFVLERDLRDIVIQNGLLSVTKFRSAEVLRVASDGSISRRDTFPSEPATNSIQPGAVFTPHALWRAVQGPSQAMVVVHQGHSTASISTSTPGGYNQGSGGVVDSHCGIMSPDGQVISLSLPSMVLPVDVAVSPDGSYAAVVGAGDGFGLSLPELTFVPLNPQALASDFGAGVPVPVLPVSIPANFFDSGTTTAASFTAEQPVAVAFDSSGHLLVQMREPAEIHIFPSQQPRHFPRLGGSDDRVRLLPPRGRRRWTCVGARRQRQADAFASRNDCGNGPLPLAGRRDGSRHLDRRRLHGAHGGHEAPTGSNGIPFELGAEHPGATRAVLGGRRQCAAWANRVRGVYRAMRNLPLRCEAHQQPDDGCRNLRDVPGPTSRRRRLAYAPDAQRLRERDGRSLHEVLDARPRQSGRAVNARRLGPDGVSRESLRRGAARMPRRRAACMR
jgi:hypothetical protein